MIIYQDYGGIIEKYYTTDGNTYISIYESYGYKKHISITSGKWGKTVASPKSLWLDKLLEQ
jgi:hypothetical protein